MSTLAASLPALALLLLPAVLCSGCAGLELMDPVGWTAQQSLDEQAQIVASPAGPPATVRVDLVRKGKKPASLELPLEPGMHVQDVLEKSGAIKKFGRMNVHVVRTLPGGQPHKMGVSFDSATRQVPPGFDYSLGPGDRVVVLQDTTTFFDDFAQSLIGPMAGAMVREQY